MVSSPSVAGSAAEPRAEQRHRDAESLDEDQRTEDDEDDQRAHRLPVELEMDAGGGADHDQREQREDEARRDQQQAEHHVGSDHESSGLPGEGADRLARLDETTGPPHPADKKKHAASPPP